MTHEERVERCNYLFLKFSEAMVFKNYEQAEAYKERLVFHKRIILDNIEKGVA